MGLDDAGRVTVVDLGDVVLLMPPCSHRKLLGNAFSPQDHLAFVNGLEDPDLATT